MIMRRTVSLTLTAFYAATAIIITILKLEIYYPLLPYLKFDFAEIPSVIAFIMVGPWSGFTSAIAHWLFLIHSSGNPLGATMKFSAVSSMLIGFWLANVILRKFKKHLSDYNFLISLCTLSGGIVRVIVMSIFNIIVLTIIAPGYLIFAAEIIRNLIGRNVSLNEALYWTLILTGLYNAIHVVFSAIPSILLIKILRKRISWIFINLGK